jgi:hypothetical protein
MSFCQRRNEPPRNEYLRVFPELASGRGIPRYAFSHINLLIGGIVRQ